MSEEKNIFRKELLERIAQLPEDYINSSNRGIYENFIALPEYRSARTIFAYISCGREPDTVAILRHALGHGKTVALPVSLKSGIMHAHIIHCLEELVPGRFNIPAPPEDAPLLKPEDVDLILVPAVTFDSKGFRMGRGGGYYDRYLAASKAFSVGLARDRLITDVPVEPHDMSVNCLVTESKAARP